MDLLSDSVQHVNLPLVLWLVVRRVPSPSQLWAVPLYVPHLTTIPTFHCGIIPWLVTVVVAVPVTVIIVTFGIGMILISSIIHWSCLIIVILLCCYWVW